MRQRILVVPFALAAVLMSAGSAVAQLPGRAEWVYIMAVPRSGNDQVFVYRYADRQAWLFDLSIGCFGLWRNNGADAVVQSPGIFAGIGSTFHVDGQQCRIWDASEFELAR